MKTTTKKNAETKKVNGKTVPEGRKDAAHLGVKTDKNKAGPQDGSIPVSGILLSAGVALAGIAGAFYAGKRLEEHYPSDAEGNLAPGAPAIGSSPLRDSALAAGILLGHMTALGASVAVGIGVAGKTIEYIAPKGPAKSILADIHEK